MSAKGLPLEELRNCFIGVVPTALATCSKEGVPNVNFLSQVWIVDARHVALSCQFFNKTKRNLLENPHASAEVYDPLTFQSYRLRLRYLRSEASGPLFDKMAIRIRAIASHTGMSEVFKLLAADVCEVLSIEKIPLLESDAAPPASELLPASAIEGELRSVQLISARINQAQDLDALLETTLASLEEFFKIEHSMVLVPDETQARLYTLASHGYGEERVGAEVRLGEGLFGTAAKEKKPLRVTAVESELRYGRAVRARVAQTGGGMAPEIPLPGIANAQSQIALPLLVGDRLMGVLAAESKSLFAFDEWDETFLQIISNQMAIAMDRLQSAEEEAPSAPAAAAVVPQPRAEPEPPAQKVREFCLYTNDDCVFVDGEYLIRNVPAKILWRLLTQSRGGRREFSNRQLRLDESLGLPAHRDNLESRLILLRKRLAEKCPEVKLVPVGRGKFTLELACPIRLEERASA